MNLQPVPYLKGLGLCLVLAAAAYVLADFIPIGAVAMAIILGILTGNLMRPGTSFTAGISFSEKHILAAAIALMGVNLDFTILRELGLRSVLLVIAGVAVTIGAALVLGAALRLDRKFALLLGIGNGVCGSSAIAATEQIVGAREEEVGLSVAIVNALGTAGIFLLPFLAHTVLRLTDLDAGLMIGNTLQAVGQVVAAGFSVSDAAGQTATIIKMTRILMLFPLVFLLLFAFAGRGAARNRASGRSARGGRPRVPGFIIGFVLLSLVPTFGLLPDRWVSVLGHASHYALIVAMAGIGLRITFASILRNGRSALLAGGAIFAVQILFSGVMVRLFF